MAQFTLGPPPIPPFYVHRSLSSRLGARAGSRDSSRSSRTRQPVSTPMEAEEADPSTTQSSLVSSVVVLEDKRMEKTAEANETRLSERIKELDLEDLECREELAEVLGLKDVSHEDLSRYHCVDWLKAHEAHFLRAKTMEAADLTGIPLKSVMGPINYRPLKQLGSPGLIEQLKGDAPKPKKIWEAIQRLFAAMNEVQENANSRFGPKTKVVFATSPGYASMPPALQFVYAMLILIAEGNASRVLITAPNRELEPTNLRLLKSELAAAWANVSHALRGFYELADILVVLDEFLLLEISNLARQLNFSPEIGDDHPAINYLTASLWFRSMDLTITSSTSKARGPSNERRNVAAAEKQLQAMAYRLMQE